MGSRLHGNDGRPRVPTVIPAKPVLRISVIPAQEDPSLPRTTVIPAKAGIQGRRGWVPVSTGTTGGRASLPSFLPNQNFAFPSFPRRKTPAQPSFPRHSREGGNPGVAGMGSRLHGNDGRPRVPTVIPAKPELRISVIPAQEDPCTTVIPATAGIQGWRGWVPVSTGTRGWVPVSTGTTHPVSAASPPLRREYIVSTFTRTGRRRAWRRRSRSGAAPPCPRASPARRRRRSARASAPSCRSGSGSRPS